MTTIDDRLVASSTGTSMNGNPLGLILNQLILITIILKQIAGITDDDSTLLDTPQPNFLAGSVNQTVFPPNL